MKIIFLHGLGQNKSSWQQTIQYLGDKEVECLEVISSGADGQTFMSLADKLASQLDKEQEPVILCGLSLGAVLGLELYFRHSDKIAALILIAGQYKMPTKMIDLQNKIFKWLPNRLFSKIGLSKSEMISIASSMRLIDYSDKLESINCPVYVVCGDKDRANKKAAISLHEMLSISKLTIIGGAGHEVNKDKPKELAEFISQAYTEIVGG